MAQITTQQLNTMFQQADSSGVSREKIVENILSKGHTIQGLDNQKATQELATSNIEQRGGLFREGVEDIKGIGRGIKESLADRRGKVEDIEASKESGETGAIRGAFQRIGQGAGLASDVIGETVLGGIKAVTPQRVEEFVGEKVQEGAEIAGLPKLLERFESLKQTNPELARDIDAVMGFGSLALDVAAPGVGGKVARALPEGAVTKGLKTAAKPVTVPAGVAGKVTTKAGSEISGALTGTSGETIEELFRAVRRGGDEATNATNALRKQTTPEQIGNSIKDSVDTVKTARNEAFKQDFNAIRNEIVDTSKIKQGVNDSLNKFNISTKDGVLDFTNSKLRTVPAAQTKLQNAYDEVIRFGDDATLEQIDTSRQALKALRLSGDDASANVANAMIDEATDIIRTAGSQVDGYKKLLGEFAESSDFLDNLTKGLSAGDKASIDQTYRRVITSLKTNNEARLSLVKELDEATGGNLLATIAGQQLSEELPRGIFRQIAAGMAAGGIVTGGLSTSLLPTLVFASPRIVGETIRALGLTAKKADIVIKAISDARKALSKTFNVDANDLTRTLFLPPSTVTESLED